MNDSIYIPNRLRSAARELRQAMKQPLNELPHETFIRAWCCVAYLFPGLHPDGFAETDSGWPRVLKRFAAEAWHRADAGELADEELYPSDAQWSGLYDRMFPHTADEIERRLALAADYGESNAADVPN
ncbi:MAG: hypothetical protein ABSD57_13115 [Verrucomicrobiota bacterium]|jgi:hypothetical protein